MARPRKEIDKKDFESLLAIQCTQEEIKAFIEAKTGETMSIDTIERWCKRTYKKSFAEVSAEKKAVGKISLRRAGFELAKKNPAVHIFYCKNYLGMTDKQEVVQETKLAVTDNFLDALSDSAAEDWESDEDETTEDSSV
jgi:hypothetical protein